jgi:hypothetical protein
MPLFSPTLTSATFTQSTGVLVTECSLPENRNGGGPQVRLNGGSTWIPATSAGAYASTGSTDTFDDLAVGSYDVRYLTGDGEYSNILLNEFTVASTGSAFVRRQSLMVGLAISTC